MTASNTPPVTNDFWHWLFTEQPLLLIGFVILMVIALGLLIVGSVRNRNLWWSVHKQNQLMRKIAWQLYLQQVTSLGHVDIEELLFYCHEQDLSDPDSAAAIELLQAAYYDATDYYGSHLSRDDASIIIAAYILHKPDIDALGYQKPTPTS